MTIGARIRESRTRQSLTQAELAEQVGVTQGIVSAWENDERTPRLRTLMALCEVLGESTDWLTGRAG